MRKRRSLLPLIALAAVIGCAFINIVWGSRILDRVDIPSLQARKYDRQTISRNDGRQRRTNGSETVDHDVITISPIRGDLSDVLDEKPSERDASKMGGPVEETIDARAHAPTTTLESHQEKETHLGRFPTYGSEEFSRQCAWTAPRQHYSKNCTILARPPVSGGEGISNWISQVVLGHIVAQQAGCKFLLDYGPGIAVEEVVTPFATDWRVPPGFACDAPPCFVANHFSKPEDLVPIQEAAGMENKMALVPTYRHAYSLDTKFFDKMGRYHDIQRVLPAFGLKNGMGCSLGSLFRLAPTATKYQPDLFDRILPLLQAKDSLVLSLYFRTGQTEKPPGSKEGLNLGYKNRAEAIMACAINQEKRLLQERPNTARIVWMVVTDSQYIKKMVPENYDGTNVTMCGGASEICQRQVISTKSRGAHTKTVRGPSTPDFAEAFIDWYLIGESDIVVTDDVAPSFGDTAAFRTTRPYYKIYRRPGQNTCAERIPVYNWN